MKKIGKMLLVIAAVLCLTACGKKKEEVKEELWKKDISIDNLYISDDSVKGKIENKTDKYIKANLELNYIKEDSTKKGPCEVILKPYENKDINCITALNGNGDFIKEIDGYEISIDDVVIIKHRLSELKENDEITSVQLNIFYEDIYKNHYYNTYDLNNIDASTSEYPYITNVIYKPKGKNYMVIYNKNEVKDSYTIDIYDMYDLDTNKLDYLKVTVHYDNEEQLEEIRNKIYLSSISIDETVLNRHYIREALRKKVKSGCYSIGSYCYSYNDLGKDQETGRKKAVFNIAYNDSTFE